MDTLQKRQFGLQLRGGQAVSKCFCMPYFPGLRSPYDKVRLVYFDRMLDKIGLHATGKLPPDYQSNLGDGQPKLNEGGVADFLG